MSTILDAIRMDPLDLPKYTRYELGEIVKLKRINEGKSIEEVASFYNVPIEFWKSIENASRSYNVKMYKTLCDYTGMTKDEVLATEKSQISYRTQEEDSEEIKQAVIDAETIFNEMVMQRKIGV